MSDAYFPWADDDVYDFRAYDPTASIFAGMSTPALQALLAQAQTAYGQLMLGAKGVTFSYDQGGGAKSVTYTPASVANLTQFIRQLQLQLGTITRGRRAVRVRF